MFILKKYFLILISMVFMGISANAMGFLPKKDKELGNAQGWYDEFTPFIDRDIASLRPMNIRPDLWQMN